MKKVFFALLGFILSVQLFAQQDAHFSQYMFTPLLYNPAFAGEGQQTQIQALHRNQWLGYESSFGTTGAPTTQMLTYSAPFPSIKGGIGGVVIRDQLGPQTNLLVNASYAYHHKFKRKGQLSAGLKVGIFSQTLNFDLLRFIDPDDPKLAGNEGKVSQAKPDLAFGLKYSRNNYYVGLGVNHLIASKYDFGATQANTLKKHFYLSAGYLYELNFDYKAEFSGLLKSDLIKTSFDLSAIIHYKDFLWGGLSFRQSEALILLLGIKLLKNKALRIGYGLDYIVKDKQAKQATSHEIMIQYNMIKNLGKRKPVRTPRFRY